jgi:hypothetical protein
MSTKLKREDILFSLAQLICSFIDIATRLRLAIVCSLLKRGIYSIPLRLKIERISNIPLLQYNVTALTAKVGEEKELTLLGQCTKLTKLDLTVFNPNTLNITRCINLKQLHLSGTIISLDFLDKLPKLEELYLNSCRGYGLTPFKDILNLTRLSIIMSNLHFYPNLLDYCFKLRRVKIASINLSVTPSFNECPNLTCITFFNCRIDTFYCPSTAQTLRIKKCNEFTNLIGGENLATFTVDVKLLNLTSLGKCTHLTKIKINSYSDLDVSSLISCRKLERIELTSRNEILNFSRFLSLINLVISGKSVSLKLPSQLQSFKLCNFENGSNFNLAELSNCPNLIALTIEGIKVTNSQALQSCPNLKEISISHEGLYLSHLDKCTKLERIKSYGISQVSLFGLKNCDNLVEIKLHSAKFVTLDALYSLSNVREVDFSFCNDLVDIHALSTLPYLEKVTLSFCHQLKSVKCLSECPILKKLLLTSCTDVTDISEFKSLSLKELSIQSCNVTNLNFVLNNPNLQFLCTFNIPELIDITPLSQLKYLSRLDISGTGVTDIRALASCFNLRILEMIQTRVGILEYLLQCPLTFLNIEECHCIIDLEYFLERAPLSLVEIRYTGSVELPPRIKRI